MGADTLENDAATAENRGSMRSPAIPASPLSRLVIGRRLWLTVHKYIGLYFY